MKNLTIGITINIKEKENIWNNGIAQNVINLALLLKNSTRNYNILILNTSENNNLEYKINGIDIYPIKDKIKDIDLLFILGSQILEKDYNYLKNKGCKIIYYSCGANYIIDMQSILYKPETKKKFYNHIPDEAWIIPQNYEMNSQYFETIYRTKVREVPFIWSPTFIDYVINNHKIDCIYKPSNEPKRISCFEPNIDIVKYTMYNILVVEQLYRENPELIKHFYITNTHKIKSNPLFIDIMNKLDIVRNKIATFEGRYKMPYFLHNFTDVVIAHQWGNPLNYSYLDALYLNYPIVHNADLIKDAGYYYPKFNIKKGKEQLLNALTNHDNNIDKYNENSKKTLEKYLPTNEKTIEKYDKLISNLFKIKKNNKIKKNKLSVLVVNINNLKYTRNCINDLLSQTNNNFDITLIDQGSVEYGTKEYLNSLSKIDNINIVRNSENVSLNKLWNNFYLNTNSDYLCFLNNDVRLTDNFIDDTIKILDGDEKAGIVIHSTNSFKFNKKLDKLKYCYSKRKVKQGWDYTIRKKVYEPIPETLKFYCGDDWVFHNVYKKGYDTAICVSSPIIHYAEKSSKYSTTKWTDDEKEFEKLGLKRYLPHYNELTEVLPTFKEFGDNSIKTIVYNKGELSDNIKKYSLNGKMINLEKRLSNEITDNNIKIGLIDSIKIQISILINEKIENGLDYLLIKNNKYISLYKKHLPNISYIDDVKEFNGLLK